MGDRIYAPGEMLSPEDRATLTERQISTLWQLGQIDTLPAEMSDAELEQLTAPAQKVSAKQQQARR